MSKFGDAGANRLHEVLSLVRGDGPNGYREGAALFAEAGQTWEKVVELCSRSLAGKLMDANNIEDLFSFVEALREDGLTEVRLPDQRYSLDYIATMIRLWIWSVYHYCPIGSTTQQQCWREHREPYVSLATEVELERLRNRVFVLTTNYDLIFESLLLNETKSLRADAGLPLQFTTRVDDGDKPIVGERSEVPIRKLHGSIDLFTIDSPAAGWLEEGHDGHLLPAVRRELKPRLMQADKLDKTRHAEGRLAVLQLNSMLKLRRRHGESLTPAIAPPSFYKGNRYDWLRHTWREAHDSLLTAKHVIFVGYSMPPSDGHLRGLFATSLALRTDPPTIRVLDSSQSVVDRFREAFCITQSDRMYCGPFESAAAIQMLKQWLQEASS